jgi:hypothetical protein
MISQLFSNLMVTPVIGCQEQQKIQHPRGYPFRKSVQNSI